MTKIGTAVGALTLSAMMLTAVPAQAAESRSLGAKSCSSGGVATEARSNTTQTHRHNANERRFTNTSGAFRTATYYGGLRSVSSSSVSTSGDGFFATPAPRVFCDF